MKGPRRVGFDDLADRARMVLTIKDGRIATLETADPDEISGGPMICAAPAFCDLQMNGRWGISFSDPTLTVDQVIAIIRAQAELGVARVCPTLITAPFEAMRHGVATIAKACEAEPDVGRMVLGIHLEGPSISEVDGYRGAHPREAVRGPDWSEFEALQTASGGRVVLITLAPERPGAIDFIERATRSGLTIAIGHTAADAEMIGAAVAAGARISTHLGNGIATPLPRHPNPIWVQAAEDRLTASFIVDGHHLDRSTLRALLRAKADRRFLVSDASPLAGLPVGRYGDWAVDPSGKVVVAGTPYLAGATRDLEFAVNEVLAAEPSMSVNEAVSMATVNPPIAIGRGKHGSFTEGDPANLIRFECDHEARRIRLIDTCVDGRWVARGEAAAPAGIVTVRF